MKDANSNSRLIYSTDLGSVCPDCDKPKDSCVCRQIKRKAVPEARETVRIRYETVGRKGKGMTLITGLPLSQEALLDLVKKLKQRFGAGGSVKDYTIELQGDHRQQAAQELRGLGYWL